MLAGVPEVGIPMPDAGRPQVALRIHGKDTSPSGP